MNQTLKVTRKSAESIINATFPEYQGRKVQVEFSEKITFFDTNWSGGTKNEYVAIKADGRKAKLNAPAPWVNIYEGASVPLTPEIVVVERSYFCGKDCGITIHANPCYLPKWLTA